jgi:hypothetical protein
VKRSMLLALACLALVFSAASGSELSKRLDSHITRNIIERAIAYGRDDLIPKRLLVGSSPDEILTVRDARTNAPVYRLVLLRSAAGRVVGLVGIDADSDQWLWYAFGYPYGEFPPVSQGGAERRVRAARRAIGMTEDAGQPVLVQGCDKHIYWRFSPGGESWLVDAVNLDAAILSSVEGSARRAITPSRRLNSQGLRGQGSPDGLGESPEALADPIPAACVIPGIPYHFQITSWYCGPASLQMMMDYLGEEVGQHNIADVANDVVGSGCISDDMRRSAHFSGISTAIQDPLLQGYVERQLGYACMDVNLLTNMSQRLKNTLYAQYPVFTLTWYDAGHTSGHYRVVKGYDDSLDVFVIHDPWYAGGLCGPDVLINQSYFVDDLWDYSGHWCMVVTPWLLTPTLPSSVSQGDTFSVDLRILYPGPTRFGGQFASSAGQAAISLSSGLALAGGSSTVSLPSLASGDSTTVSWDVVAVGPDGDWGMAFQAQGTISGSSSSYPSYTDSIGGHAYETITAGGGLAAGWEAEERLTSDDGSSQTCFPGARAMVAGDGGTIHLVWADTRDDTGEIYYRRRVGGGWDTAVRLTQQPAYCHSPCIAEGPDGRLHVAWADSRDGNYEIYYKYWDPTGGWSSDERVTTYGEVDCNPAVAAGDSAVYLVWEQRQGGAFRVAAVIFSMRTDLGWSAPTDIDASAARDSYRPSLAYGPEGLVHLVYERQTANDPDEHEKVVYRSWDGVVWSGRTGLSTDLSFSRNPVVAVGADSSIHVVWQDGENVGSDIFYCFYDGVSWQAAEQIVTGGTEVSTPSIAVTGAGQVQVAWVDHRHGQAELYHLSKDEIGWGGETRVTHASGASLLPTVAADSTGTVSIVWTDLRHGNADLYFITTSSSGVGEKLVGLPPGAIVHLLEPYPVPSSGKTRVEFIVAEPSHILFEVFDVKGRLIREVADAKYGAGIYSISWDGTCASGQLAAPGVYFLRCLAPKSQQVRRLVVVR